MSVKQYIGARYVPIFMGEHDSNKSYEPLSIVTDAGANSSYTSKKFVPIGIDLTNTEYWALTGTVSGAIVRLTERVNAIENRVNVQAKNVRDQDALLICIGDSYMDGTALSDYETPVTQIAAHFNKTIGENCLKWTKGGLGFLGAGNNSVLTYINTRLPELSQDDKQLVTDIVIGVGYNDAHDVDYSMWGTLCGKIESVSNLLHSEFPNATIYLANICAGWTNVTSIKKEIISGAYYYSSVAYNLTPLGNVGNCLKIADNQILIASDGIHPTKNGSIILGRAIADAMESNYNGTSWYYNSSVAGIIAYIENDVFKLDCQRGLNLTTGLGSNIICNSENAIATVDITTDLFGNDIELTGTCDLQIRKNDNTFVVAPAVIRIKNGVIQFCPRIINNSGTNYEEITATFVSINPFTVAVNLTTI